MGTCIVLPIFLTGLGGVMTRIRDCDHSRPEDRQTNSMQVARCQSIARQSLMNKFRKLGQISYNGRIEVNSLLLDAVLHEAHQAQSDP